MEHYFHYCRECKKQIAQSFKESDKDFKQKWASKVICPVRPEHDVVIRSNDFLSGIF